MSKRVVRGIAFSRIPGTRLRMKRPVRRKLGEWVKLVGVVAAALKSVVELVRLLR
jgi:hypothetical protein